MLRVWSGRWNSRNAENFIGRWSWAGTASPSGKGGNHDGRPGAAARDQPSARLVMLDRRKGGRKALGGPDDELREGLDGTQQLVPGAAREGDGQPRRTRGRVAVELLAERGEVVVVGV